MNRVAWLIFAGLVAAVGIGFLGFTTWEKQVALLRAEATAAELRAQADTRKARTVEVEQLLGQARERADALAREMAQATNTQQRLETEMRDALQSRDVAVSELQGKLMVTIVDRILFDSGEAQLKPEGMRVLDQVAGVLSGFTNRQVQVFGHTDNRPIRLKFPSNWELSAARAVAAVRHLNERAGVEARRLSAVGCGEFQPIADNSTAEGRARNRRIALVVLPEQFVPTDVLRDDAAISGMLTNTPASVPTTNPPLPGLSTDAAPVENRTNIPPVERAGPATNAPAAGVLSDEPRP